LGSFQNFLFADVSVDAQAVDVVPFVERRQESVENDAVFIVAVIAGLAVQPIGVGSDDFARRVPVKVSLAAQIAARSPEVKRSVRK